MVGFREPGFLWKIDGPQFVWGPIGGMALTPISYFKDGSFFQRFLILFKNGVNRLQRDYSFRVKKALRRSDCVICATPDELNRVTVHYREKAVWISETGTDCIPSSPLPKQSHTPLRLIWVGRFIPSKQLGLALQVMARLQDSPVHLDIVGSGSEKEIARYVELAKDLNLEKQITWHGKVSHEETGRLMSESDAFFFSSVFEATSTVVMEAISHGLPVVCFDTCGFGPLIDDGMGIKIPISDPKESIGQFAEAIQTLIAHPEMLSAFSKNALAKADSLTWDAKIKMVLELYNGLIDS